MARALQLPGRGAPGACSVAFGGGDGGQRPRRARRCWPRRSGQLAGRGRARGARASGASLRQPGRDGRRGARSGQPALPAAQRRPAGGAERPRPRRIRAGRRRRAPGRAGLLGPDALLREALAELLAAEGMALSGAASLTTRAEERGAGLWGGPDRTSEMGLGSAWAGGAFELSFELRGQVALYLAARALDAALLVELAARAGRAGAQQWMDALFTIPLGAAAPHEAAGGSIAERRARLEAELSALAEAARRRAA